MFTSSQKTSKKKKSKSNATGFSACKMQSTLIGLYHRHKPTTASVHYAQVVHFDIMYSISQ
eukprot:UN04864